MPSWISARPLISAGGSKNYQIDKHHNQPSRRFLTGSTCTARHSGTLTARLAIATTPAPAAITIVGSATETPKTKALNHRDATQQPTAPAPIPIAASLIATRLTHRTIAARRAPIA